MATTSYSWAFEPHHDFLLNNNTEDDGGSVAVTSNAAGTQFLATWHANLDHKLVVKGRLFDADGSPLTSEFVADPYHTSHSILPNPAALPDGRYVVAINSASDT